MDRPVFFKSISKKLREELGHRQERNSQYSIRSFARDLGIAPSALHDYLNEKKVPSVNKIKELCEKLSISKEEILNYTTLVKSRDKEDEIIWNIPFTERGSEEEVANVHSDLYHFAYLGLRNMPHFVDDRGWIAQKLQVELSKVIEIEERLVCCGILKKNKEGAFTVIEENKNFRFSKVPNSDEVKKRFHKSSCDIFQKSMNLHSPEEVSHSVMFFVSNKEKMELAKNKIIEFRREFATLMGDVDEKNQLYTLSVSVNPLLKLDE